MEMVYPRRKTREVRVGNVTIGGQHPIVVQSMITENTRDVAACVEAIIRLHELGCEIVRVTTPTLADAHSLREIKHTL
ncbi:MAG: flavodoxin-dependent (E)-4-hydroxy-3-methylbut-2-enyl-diphosphate synthase, partial [Gemmatimonadetes bacterium]|nr:flavodoxin-dependent (E)-4-hydroxy-3-methylbut-2-enyl-diphosphate synthase [Gemmatimonadota bacterium]